MKMKRILLAMLLTVCLTAALPVTAAAEGETFNAYLDLNQNEDGSVSVTIPEENAAVLTAEVPTLSIPCAMGDPAVSHNGALVSSSAENGKVTFPVAEPGVYTITDNALPHATVLSFSLTLEGQIGLNFRVRIPAELQESVHAVTIYKGTESSVELGSPISGTTDEFRFTVRVASKEIGNPIGLRIADGAGKAVTLVNSSGAAYENCTAVYAVADYCRIENVGRYDPNGRGEQLEALTAALQNYGAYALAYFHGNDIAPGFASSGADLSGVNVSGYGVVKTGAATGLSQTTMFLKLDSETTINLRFTVAEGHSIEEYSFSCGETALVPEPNNGSYLIRLTNIPARHLDTAYTVTARRGDEVFSVTCSALSYAQLALTNSRFNRDAGLCNLVKALYLYNQAANAYFE